MRVFCNPVGGHKSYYKKRLCGLKAWKVQNMHFQLKLRRYFAGLIYTHKHLHTLTSLVARQDLKLLDAKHSFYFALNVKFILKLWQHKESPTLNKEIINM